jgi:HSP20 family molecular chaperone IbpA
MTPAFEDDSAQTIQHIEANIIEESEENFKIEMKIDGFKADEINIRLCQNHVLNVYGERKKNPENPNEENKHFRKSFGRVFWIPDGCKKEEITAKTRMEDSILILEISVPMGGESSSEDNEEMREIYIQQI